MTNPFSSYLVIDAGSIVRSNIRPDHIKDDVKSLLEVLERFDYLGDPNIQEGFVLGRHIVKEIDTKRGLLDLLKYYGLKHERTGEFVYQPAETKTERERRKNGVNEIKKLSRDLKSARNGSLDGFQEFIRNRNTSRVSSSSSSDDSEPDDEPLPRRRPVEDRNAATMALIRSFKENLVTEYNANPSASFIRRRLSRLSFRQIYPESRSVDDDTLDTAVDIKISSLKEKHRQKNAPCTDHVYMECLIRANFNETEALQILKHNPPNLEVPIAPVVPQTSIQTPLANVVEPLKQHYRSLNQQNNNNEFTRQSLRAGDPWENCKYIVPAIRQIRQKSTGATADDAIFSQLCRLLKSELLPRMGPQLSLTIELFARMICDSSFDTIENLDIATVKNILSSSQSDNFSNNAKNLLSMQCPICLGSFPRNQMESMFLCDHQCCLDCLKNYYRTNINSIQDNRSLSILTCFCTRHEITTDNSMNFFTYIEAKFNQWFKDEPDVLRKYNDKKFEATRGTHIKHCGNSKCTSSFFVDENDAIASSRCTHCQFAQCRQCGRKWNDVHIGMTCDEYAEWLIHDDPENPDNLALSFLGSNMILCPSCREIFEYKAGGCEHFTCRSCETNFCRMCSSLFYSPNKNPQCPHNNCTLKNTFHAHCTPNCFREIRDESVDAMITLLNNNDIDVAEELQAKPILKNHKCPTESCKNNTSAASGHRLCDICYKQFLCFLIWNHQLDPWEVYDDDKLQRILTKAPIGIRIPATATRADLIGLCQEHLNQSLGKPKKPRL